MFSTVTGSISPVDLHFVIRDIQTTILSESISSSNACFFVSARVNGTTRKTVPVAIKERALHWNETLDGFVLGPSSQLELQIFKKRTFSDKLMATFVIPCEELRLSPERFVVRSDFMEIRLTWSQCRNAESLPEPSSDTTEKPVPLPLDVADRVEKTRLQFQDTKRNAKEMNNPPESATNVVDASKNVGPILDTTAQAVTSVQRFLDKCKAVSDRLGFVVGAVDAIVEIHPYAKMAWSVISFIPKKISNQIQLDKDVMDLLDAMETALDLAPDAETLISRCKSNKREITLIRLLEQIEECGRFIQAYVENESFWERFRKNFFSETRTVVDNYRQVLRKLHDAFLGQVIVTVESNVFLIHAEVKAINENVKEFGNIKELVKDVGENIKGIDLDLQLDKLQYGKGTQFDSNKCCLPKTRVKFLDAIMDWVNDPNLSSPNVLVLFGQAGTGKSSIANELALRYSRMNRLTTSYVFVRDFPSGREPYLFFTTLARDLCRIWPAFKVALWKLIKEKPELASTYNYTTLVESLLQGPLGGLFFVGPIFIVIDALDENEDASRKPPPYAGNNNIPFHTALSQFVPKLPSNFRILITSRPDTEFEGAFPESSFIRHMKMDDPQLADRVNDDILIYMRTKIRVEEDDLGKLVNRAQCLFQWAFVACEYIGRPPWGLNSTKCLANILSSSQPISATKELDKLYSTVLNQFDMKDPQIRQNFCSIMTQVLGTFEPLSIPSLNNLRQCMPTGSTDGSDITDVVKHMGSLLSNTSSHSTLPIAPLHTSFRDFLTDESRSGHFYINLDKAHDDLAMATLRMMQDQLKFNICKLETSYLLNSEVKDLKERIKKFIPPGLSYSCRFWAEHRARVSEFNSDVFECLRVLLEKKFLFWLEVLSVEGELPRARRALVSLQMWLNQMHDKIKGMGSFDALINDAIAFIKYFGYPMAQSAPHIYLSALPLAPSPSVIAKCYTPQFPNTFRVEKGGWTKWPAQELTISLPDKKQVGCIAWSGNDEYIAAGSRKRAYIWNTLTGMRVGRPITVDSPVLSIALSHDGQRLALSLRDGMVLIWEVMTGQKMVLAQHTFVSAASFSKDGKHLMGAAPNGGYIWIWDLEKMVPFAESYDQPLYCNSVHLHRNTKDPFSSDETRNCHDAVSFLAYNIVLRSRARERFDGLDMTVDGHIDTATYHFHECFKHHSLCLESSLVVCSWFDQDPLAPGSHLWTHVVAFSPDGKLVATCCPNHIHVWHATGEKAGTVMGGPFSNEGVICLAFSADGQRLVSGSEDGTVRVWNVQLIANEDASGSVNREELSSVAIMSGGKQIVVGQRDGTVEVQGVSEIEQKVVKIRKGDDKSATVAVSLNDDWIASGVGKEMVLWSGAMKAFANPPKSTDNGQIQSVAFSPYSNDLVAFGTYHGTVCVFNMSTGAAIAGPLEISSGAVTSLALSPSAWTTKSLTPKQTCVAVATCSGIYVWDTTLRDIAGPYRLHSDWVEVRALAFFADGRHIISVARDNIMCVWVSTNGKLVNGPVKFRDGEVTQKFDGGESSCMGFIPAGDGWEVRVACPGEGYRILLLQSEVPLERVTEVDLRQQLVLGHADDTKGIAFSNDGQFLATTSRKCTIRVWNLQAAMERKRNLLNSTSDDSELINFDEAEVDKDGWAVCTNGHGHIPLRRLMWVPGNLRLALHRPSNVGAVSGQKETRLGLENFVHGKDWVKCMA